MKYFGVSFPNSTVFFLKTSNSYEVKDVVKALVSASGFKSFGDTVYNPKQFISVFPSTESYASKGRNIEEALF